MRVIDVVGTGHSVDVLFTFSAYDESGALSPAGAAFVQAAKRVGVDPERVQVGFANAVVGQELLGLD